MEASPGVEESGGNVAYQQFAARAHRGSVTGAIVLIALAIGAGLIVGGSAGHAQALTVVGLVVVVAAGLAMPGFVVVQPNESRVLILLGRYVGTVLEAGLWWVNPLTLMWRETISLRVRNFQGARIKVNDASGN